MSQSGSQTGLVIGLARRAARLLPMQEIGSGLVAEGGGLEGDHKGLKFKNRGLTVLAIEAWEAALLDLAGLAGPPALPWTTRRANILVEGVVLPRARGGLVRLGPVLIEITDPTVPCRRMEDAHSGLLKALYPDWRGGITARVLEGGLLAVGDRVDVLLSPAPHVPKLPG